MIYLWGFKRDKPVAIFEKNIKIGYELQLRRKQNIQSGTFKNTIFFYLFLKQTTKREKNTFLNTLKLVIIQNYPNRGFRFIQESAYLKSLDDS